MNDLRCGVFATAIVFVAGCGNGSGPDDPANAPFASRAGALREVGQLGNILIGGQRLFGARQSSPRFVVTLGAPPPMDCESDTVAVQQGERSDSLAYFSKTDTFAYSRYVFSGCTTLGEGEGESVRQDGELERAAEAEHDPLNLSDSFDQYVVYGSDGSAYAYVRTATNAAGAVTEQISEEVSGRIEVRDSDIGREAGSVLIRVLQLSQPDAYTLEWRQGNEGDPLYAFDQLGLGLTVDGSYAWSSSRCADATRRIKGEIARDDDGYPSTGELTIDAGEESVVITFEDGGAQLSFSNGRSASLSAQEIRRALDEPAC